MLKERWITQNACRTNWLNLASYRCFFFFSDNQVLFNPIISSCKFKSFVVYMCSFFGTIVMFMGFWKTEQPTKSTNKLTNMVLTDKQANPFLTRIPLLLRSPQHGFSGWDWKRIGAINAHLIKGILHWFSETEGVNNPTIMGGRRHNNGHFPSTKVLSSLHTRGSWLDPTGALKCKTTYILSLSNSTIQIFHEFNEFWPCKLQYCKSFLSVRLIPQ